jgi:HEAT repeat protein
MLGDTNEKQRTDACRALGDLKAVETQSAVARMLRTDPALGARQTAASVLERLGELEPGTVASLLDAIAQEKDARLRGSATRALRGAAPSVTPALVQLLRDDKAVEVRAAAAYALRGAAAGPDVLTQLRFATAADQPPAVRVEAAHALAQLAPDEPAPIRVLAGLVTNGPDGQRYAALRALHDLGPRSAPAVPVLLKVLEKERYEPNYIDDAWYALHTLARIGPGAKEALPFVLARLDRDAANPNWSTERTKYIPVGDNIFAYTAARLGPAALPDLMRLAKDENGPRRRAALTAGAPLALASMPVYLALWKDDIAAQKRQRAAVIALGYMGPPARDALPTLQALRKTFADAEVTSDEDEWLDTALAKAIARIGDPKAMSIETMQDR